MHFMLQQGNPVADVAVYIGDFAPQMTGPANPVPAGYDYDYMGSDAILNNLDVVNGKWVVYDEKQRRRIAASYELLAMPESGHIRPHVLKRLEELKKAGGKVVQSSPVPVQSLQKLGVVPIVSEATCGLRWKARQLDDGMLFFLSNFEATGTFEAKLRVTGKVPELFNPVSGEIKKMVRYKVEKDGTRICIRVNDRSDSFFVIFREPEQTASVVKVQAEGKEVGPGDLALYYDSNHRLTAESGSKGSYTLTMSDGTEKTVRVEKDSESLPVGGAWTTANKDKQGFSVFKEVTFTVPADFGNGQKVELDLGRVARLSVAVRTGESFYGLGEKFTALDKWGQEHTFWATDSGNVSSYRSYKNIPLLLSSQGYGLLIHSSHPMVFRLGSESNITYSVHLADTQFDAFLIFGPQFKDILSRYAANRLRVVRQVHNSQHNENSIDLGLFLNGLPVATAELKTDFTQSIGDAIDQYRFDRLPKPKGQVAEPLLSFPRGALVHFAVSNTEVHTRSVFTPVLSSTHAAQRQAQRSPFEDQYDS